MYKCELCGRVVEPGQPAIKRVVETRVREYAPRQNPNGKPPKRQDRSRKRNGDPGGTGTEIVQEQLLCASCSESADSGG
jgi:hypothetical protein